MKLQFPDAYISAVPNLMLKMGTGDDASLVPATCLCIRAEVAPEQLNQLREGLADVFFEKATAPKAPRVPSLPELAALNWKTEYECTAIFDLEELDDLDFDAERLAFTGVDVKAITFDPLPSGQVEITCNVIVKSDVEGRGQLSALLKHRVGLTLTKLSQKALMEPAKPKDDAASSAQAPLPLTPPSDGSEATKDGEPIQPLMH